MSLLKDGERTEHCRDLDYYGDAELVGLRRPMIRGSDHAVEAAPVRKKWSENKLGEILEKNQDWVSTWAASVMNMELTGETF